MRSAVRIRSNHQCIHGFYRTPSPRSEDTLRLHFSQFGVVEAAEVMKDRFTGKSRGFGFVTFVDPASAARALSVEHTVDGRRCEAKVALPKALLLDAAGNGGAGSAAAAAAALGGGGAPLGLGLGGAGAGGGGSPPAGGARTTRIFVARIPAAVSEGQFRGYFEKFGRLQVGWFGCIVCCACACALCVRVSVSVSVCVRARVSVCARVCSCLRACALPGRGPAPRPRTPCACLLSHRSPPCRRAASCTAVPQDAYMPKDHSKQAYRGIGFVTFASPESVERVLSCKHW